ncbi:isoprenyl transferase [Paenibacillus albiflavus]|uniref:Isoprenyl transferase n=1 Tax=Paenibacillus albiflavus TaxID=2545760 RepID=A0A4R4EIS2_9BACL|nr:isoprenyl transferase [Paenibacillus albiflavus]TCZ79293.1 isoprenyl transferase [Paenibacillus albiflavus]
MLFFKKSPKESTYDQFDIIPEHIAIMMDGNGRWATRKGMPRTAGHYAGMQSMRETIRNCYTLKIKYLTLYAFSTENWARPIEEVNYLVSLPQLFFQDEILSELISHNVQVKFIGNLSRFPESIQDIMQKAKDLTSMNTGMVLNFAMNYGGKAEIIQAIKRYAEENQNIEELDEDLFEKYLYTKDCPSPDLIIRTSGEHRLSNFLLWQSAKSELWFTKTLWPDFDLYALKEAISVYQSRKLEAISN